MKSDSGNITHENTIPILELGTYHLSGCCLFSDRGVFGGMGVGGVWEIGWAWVIGKGVGKTSTFFGPIQNHRIRLKYKRFPYIFFENRVKSQKFSEMG